MDVQTKKARVAWLSVGSNAVLVVLKLVVGILMGSVSVISEAIHSGIDLIAAVIALAAVRASGKPADEEHPFGHGKIENISGAVEALLIFGAAIWIIREAVIKLAHPEPLDTVGIGVLVMAASSAANLKVSQMLFKVGRETESVALQADAWHLRTDVYTSGGVMAGLCFVWLGQWLWPGVDLRWIDPAAAMAVALLIVKAAWDLTKDAVRDLLDARIAASEEERVRQIIAEFHPDVRGFHNLRTRRAGLMRFVDFHIQVDGAMTVLDSHQIAMNLSRRIETEIPNAAAIVHVEPCAGQCTDRCLAGCLMEQPQRSRVQDHSTTPAPR